MLTTNTKQGAIAKEPQGDVRNFGHIFVFKTWGTAHSCGLCSSLVPAGPESGKGDSMLGSWCSPACRRLSTLLPSVSPGFSQDMQELTVLVISAVLSAPNQEVQQLHRGAGRQRDKQQVDLPNLIFLVKILISSLY